MKSEYLNLCSEQPSHNQPAAVPIEKAGLSAMTLPLKFKHFHLPYLWTDVDSQKSIHQSTISH